MKNVYVKFLLGKSFVTKMFMVILIMITVMNSFSQVTGDFETKNATGNWSDFNSWNRFNGTVFVAATSGQIPTLSNSVFIRSAKTITVDIVNAECNNLNFATTATCLVAWNANTILNVYGNLNFGSTTGPSFSTWPSSAKLVIKGTAVQTIVNQNPNHRFVNLEIDKSAGSFAFTSANVGFDKITLTSGNVTTGSGTEFRGSTSATVNINGGTWTQTTGSNRLNGGAGGTNLGGLNISSGTMTLATTSGTPAGYNLANISITNGGILNLNNGISSINVTSNFAIDATSSLNTAMTTTPSAASMSFLGTVNYNHTTTQNIINTTYGNLILSGGGNKNTASNINVTKNISIQGSAVLPLTNLTANIGGNWTSYGTGGLTESTSTVDFNGGGAQVINTTGGEDFFIMKKSGAGTLTLNSNVAIGGTGSGLNISLGTLDAGTNTLSGTASSTLTMSGGTLKLGKLSTTLPEFTGTYSLSGGTIELYGSSAQVLKGAVAYRNLTFSGTTSTTLASNPTSITGTVNITGSALLDIGSSNGFGGTGTNLTMDGGRFKMSGNTTDKPDIDGSYNLTGGIIEFAGSSAGAQPIKGKTNAAATDIIYKNIEVTGSNVGTGVYNIFLNQAAGNFTVKGPSGVYAPNIKSIISASATNTSTVVVENGATFKIGNNKGFSGFAFTAPANSAIDANIAASNITLAPGSTVDYAGASAQIITNQVPYQNFAISSTSAVDKTAPDAVSGNLSILGNITKGTGATFVANGGTVSLDGTSVTTQTYSATDGGMEFYKLVNNNTNGGFTVASNLGIEKLLTLATNSKLIFGAGNIAIRSTVGSTASIDQLSSSAASNIDYTGTGRFIIERYLTAHKAWRFLATPIQGGAGSQTVNAAWQNGQLPTVIGPAGKGTNITGPASGIGFDAITQGYSMKSNLTGSNVFTPVTNTGSLIANENGYMLFVRGDRSVAVNGVTGTTTLQTTGKIITGTKSYSLFGFNGFLSIGNPYASQINFKTVNKVSIPDAFTIWNPSLGGNYGVGAYVTYTKDIINAPFDYKNSLGEVLNTIESGQAFYIQTGVVPASAITINESDKTTSSTNVSLVEGLNSGKQMRMNVYTNDADGKLFWADGLSVDFDNAFSNGFDIKDNKKVFNSGDNFAIASNGVSLVNERRALPTVADTIHLSLGAVKTQPYSFVFNAANIDTDIQPYLLDNYLRTTTAVSGTGETKIDVNFSSDAASKAADRFAIVFKQLALPVTHIKITSASRDRNNIATINWGIDNESFIRSYELERSADNVTFTSIKNTLPSANNSAAFNFTQQDVQPLAEVNYYRIKAVRTNGQVVYSNTVSIDGLNEKANISVYPNPVSDHKVLIQFNRQVAGKYTVQITNKLGQNIYTGTVQVSGPAFVHTVNLQRNIAKGAYQLQVIAADGQSTVQQIMVQ